MLGRRPVYIQTYAQTGRNILLNTSKVVAIATKSINTSIVTVLHRYIVLLVLLVATTTIVVYMLG